MAADVGVAPRLRVVDADPRSGGDRPAGLVASGPAHACVGRRTAGALADACGAWLGVAIAVKPFLLPLLVLDALARRSCVAVVARLASPLAIARAAGPGVFGVGQYRRWREACRRRSVVRAAAQRLAVGDGLSGVRPRTTGISPSWLTWRRWRAGLPLALSRCGRRWSTWLACRTLRSFDEQWSLVLCDDAADLPARLGLLRLLPAAGLAGALAGRGSRRPAGWSRRRGSMPASRRASRPCSGARPRPGDCC